MRHNTDVFDVPVWHRQPKLVIEVFRVPRCALECLLHERHVLRMNPLQSEVKSRFHGPFVLEDSKHFLRPEDLSSGDGPAEATGAAQGLGVSQTGFAASKRRFGLT